MRLRDKLTGKIGENDIFEICYLTQSLANNKRKMELYRLIDDNDERVAQNALWCFTKFSERENEWLFAKQDDLIDKALVEKNSTKLRLLLRILLRQPSEEENLRTDFLDFCVAKITATA